MEEKTKKYIFLILIILIIFISFFLIKNFISKNYPLITPASTIEIFYSTQWGPMMGNYDIYISNTGEVILVNKLSQGRFTSDEKEERKNLKLSATELSKLKKLVADANIFSLKNGYYSKSDIADGRGDHLKFTIDGKIKEIYIYMAPVPKKLELILNKIAEISCVMSSQLDPRCR